MKISQEDLVFGEVVFTDLRMVTGEMFDLIKNHCGGITSLECYTEIVSLISHTCQEIIDQSTVQEGMSHQIKIMTVLIFFWRVIYSANQKMILDLALNRFKKIIQRVHPQKWWGVKKNLISVLLLIFFRSL